MRNVFTCLLLLFCFSISVHAQNEKVTEFSRQTLLFSEEVTAYFSVLEQPLPNPLSGKDFANGKRMAKEFVRLWEGGYYNADQQEEIYNLSNLMLQSNVRRYPDMTNLFLTLIGIPGSSQDPDSFNKWAESIKSMLNKNEKADCLAYINMSKQLINDSTISQFKRLHWRVLSQNFYFDIEDEVPVIRFFDTDLELKYNADYIQIHGTSGTLYPSKSVFDGVGGTVYWDKVELSRKDVFADLKAYEFDIYSSSFRADSVSYYNYNFFSFPIEGVLVDQAKALMPAHKMQYPEFTSYRYDIEIDSLYGAFDYVGGVRFFGANLESHSADTTVASLSYTTKAGNKVYLASDQFNINRDFISSVEASAKIITGTDSIFHPSLNMVYINKEKLLKLSRTGSFLSESSFSDSYHKVDIIAEALYWKLTDSNMYFRHMEGIKQSSDALFESQNRYNEQDFGKLQGIDKYHPLRVISELSESHGGLRTLYISDLVSFYNMPPEQVHMLLITLTKKGFVLLDPIEGVFTINDKLYDYVKANMHQIDYDNIAFYSKETSLNALFNVNTFDMVINNVSDVKLSDSQSVIAVPYDYTITLKKNRDFVYTGQTMAGMFDIFKSQPAYFSYENFDITMPFIDSLKIFVKSNGRYEPVRSVVENLKAKLSIDFPDNKSGLKKSDSLAYLDADTTGNSAVYYYAAYFPDIYPRDQFAYQVWPFTVKDLSDFNTDDFKIYGQLLSNGILPNIEEPLKLRPDYSLGFEVKTPQNGYPLYDGKGEFNGLVDLSLNGLRGEGSLDFLNAHCETDSLTIWDSTDFVFLPDSTIGLAHKFELTQSSAGIEYPPVDGKDVWIKWLHLEDKMTIKTTSGSFLDMYDGRTRFYGSISLNAEGLSGDGTLHFDNAEMASKEFDFYNRTFDAMSSDFKIFAQEGMSAAFTASDYNAYVDFDKNSAKFEANQASNVHFPLNSYMSTMYNFDWDILEGDVELFADNEIYNEIMALPKIEMVEQYEAGLITGPELISTRQDQDSLHFFAYRAKFTLESNMLDIKEVPFIKVADAFTFPDSGHVLIEENAEMLHLQNSEFLTRNGDNTFQFYNSDIKIHSANDYFAVSDFDYYDRNDNKYVILFDDISSSQGLDGKYRTIAKAKVAEEDEFRISPEFDFYGNLELISTNPFINYNGFFQINSDCDTVQIPPISMDTLVDPMNPTFPITKYTSTDGGKPLVSGIGYNVRDMQIYTQFLLPEQNSRDSLIFQAEGMLRYDEEEERYCLASKKRLEDSYDPSNILYFSNKKCEISGEGELKFNPRIGDYIDIDVYGEFVHKVDENRTSATVNMIIDFDLPAKLQTLLKDTIKHSLGGDLVDLADKKYDKFLSHQLGFEEKVNFVSSLNIGERKVPTPLKALFVLTDVNLKWSVKAGSWYSIEPFNIAICDGELIARQYKGYIEYTKTRNLDEFRLIIETYDGELFFFNFLSNKQLKTCSTIGAYNEIVANMKKEDKGEEKSKMKIIPSNIDRLYDLIDALEALED